MKHTITFFAVVMMALAIPQSVKAYNFSAVAPSGQTLFYNIVDGRAQVTRQNNSTPYYYTYPTGNLTIPDSVTNPNNGTTYPVTSIDNYAFFDCTGLTSVSIPDGVTSISNEAFAYCTGLTSVSIPDGVTSIGSYAFYNCTGLTSVSIPNGDTSIGNYAFYNCTGLTSISIGSGVTSIGNSAFMYCSGLTSVTIPDGVTSIGSYAFGCTGLTSVSIPNSVSSIGSDAFYQVKHIEYHGSASGSPWGAYSMNGFTDGDFVYEDSSRTVLIQYIGNQATVSIPTSVTTIRNNAFCSNTTIVSVTIPNGVTSIGNYAFDGCAGLTSVSIPNSVTSIGSSAFSRVRHIEYHGSATGSPWGAYSMNGFTDGDFIYEDSSRTVLLQYIGNQATVSIPTSVTTISNKAFRGNTTIASVTIPDGVIYIGSYAFENCTGLTSVTIPDGVTSIGNYAFNQVKHIEYHGSASGSPWGAYSINGSTDGDFVYENSSRTVLLQYIGNQATVSIPSSVTTISNNAFRSNTTIVSVTIPDGVTSIGDEAFDGCSNLGAIYLSSQTPPSIQSFSFSYGYTGPVFYVPCNRTSAYQAAWGYSYTFSEVWTPYNVTCIVNNDQYGTASVSLCIDEATLTANANYGYHFTQWSDGDTSNPRILTLTQDTSFSAIFAKSEYSVTGTTNDSTKGLVSGSATVDYLDTVTLTATANYGYQFIRWSDYHIENPRRIVATGDITKTAIFDFNQYNITLQVDTSIHGSCNGGGSYNYLSERTIRANANHGYHFTQWNDENTDNPRVITLTQDTTFTANFAKNQYTLTVSSNDATLGSVVGSGIYEYLDTIAISATAIDHYHFMRWDDGNTLNPRNIIMTSDISRTAIFAIDTHSVFLQVADITNGTYSGNGEYVYGTAATVTATPYSGYQFSHWSDGSTYNPYTFAVVNDNQLTAYFHAIGEPYQDTLTIYDTITIHDTTYVPVHDTTYVPVHDTTIVYDTTIVTDTLWMTQFDTVWMYDTITIHDTIYVGVDEVDAISAKIYTSHGKIVVEGAEGNTVALYDVSGRQLAVRRSEEVLSGLPLQFDIPSSGAYLVKIGNHPARRVVVIR